MGNYVVFDAVEEVLRYYAHFHQVSFDAVGPESDDASCPTACHAWNLQQLIFRSVIQVDPRFGGRSIPGRFRDAAGISVILRHTGQAHAGNRKRKNR